VAFILTLIELLNPPLQWHSDSLLTQINSLQLKPETHVKSMDLMVLLNSAGKADPSPVPRIPDSNYEQPNA